MANKSAAFVIHARNLFAELTYQCICETTALATGHGQTHLAIEHIPVKLGLITLQVVALGEDVAGLAHGLQHFRQEQALELARHLTQS